MAAEKVIFFVCFGCLQIENCTGEDYQIGLSDVNYQSKSYVYNTCVSIYLQYKQTLSYSSKQQTDFPTDFNWGEMRKKWDKRHSTVPHLEGDNGIRAF